MTTSPEIQEIVIITGASSGIGEATAREMARRGFHVLASVRRDQDADALRAPGIEPLIIDITNADHIRALAARVHEDPEGRETADPAKSVIAQALIDAFAIKYLSYVAGVAQTKRYKTITANQTVPTAYSWRVARAAVATPSLVEFARVRKKEIARGVRTSPKA